MKSKIIALLFCAKNLMLAWVSLLILSAVLSAVKYFNIMQLLSELSSSAELISSSFLDLGLTVVFFAIIALTGIAVILKKSKNGGSKQTLTRL